MLKRLSSREILINLAAAWETDANPTVMSHHTKDMKILLRKAPHRGFPWDIVRMYFRKF